VISLDTAKKLKDAGLKWEPQEGDWFYWWVNGAIDVLSTHNQLLVQCSGGIFAPRLDQLLAEIEKRGYWCAIMPTNAVGIDVNYLAELYRLGELSGHLELVWRKEVDGFLIAEFRADSPEEAATLALIWILEQDKPKCPYCNGDMPCLTCSCD